MLAGHTPGLLKLRMEPGVSPDKHAIWNLWHTLRLHMHRDNLQHMVLMPGDHVTAAGDVTAQDSVDTFGVIGQECLHSLKAGRPLHRSLAFSIIPHPPSGPQAWPHMIQVVGKPAGVTSVLKKIGHDRLPSQVRSPATLIFASPVSLLSPALVDDDTHLIGQGLSRPAPVPAFLP